MRSTCLRLVFLLSSLAPYAFASGAQQSPLSQPSRVPQPILTPEFTRAIQEILDSYGVPGLTLAVVRRDGPTELGAWGIKSEDGAGMTTDTLFNIGSCSKAFLSIAMGILIDDFAHGRNATPLPPSVTSLTWESKLADILPDDWELMDPWASKKASLIDILSHVSGMPRHDLSYMGNESTRGLTRNLRNLRPLYELREKYEYNNQMFMVGSHVISLYSGMRFRDFARERIFEPLGMNLSTYSMDEAIRSGKATETWTSFGRLIPSWLKEEYVDLVAGPGGVVSNVEELVSSCPRVGHLGQDAPPQWGC
ncbi:beta-lactamase/transpeptidase-like protein [Gloeopeniophorella convolvens]|nr:beta-lactamase/transpeptidase-like protein [Gloeopeniophorella convolvens]